jgi:hypothetical protein
MSQTLNRLKQQGLGELLSVLTYLPTDKQLYRAFATHPVISTRAFAGQEANYEDIKVKVRFQDWLGAAQRQRLFREVCAVFPSAKLAGTLDSLADFVSYAEKVRQLESPELTKLEFGSLSFELWKNVTKITRADESRMKLGDTHAFSNWQTQQAGTEDARMENSQITEVLLTATEISGSDWGSDTTNPADDITAAIEAIQTATKKRYVVDYVLANFGVWADYVSNPHTHTMPGLRQSIESQSVTSFPLLPGITGFCDSQMLPSDVAIIGCRFAPSVALVDGPVQSASYRDESAGGEAYYFTHWLQPILALPDTIRRITGVHA